MKRLICLLLIFCLFLSGCSVLGERFKEPVTFYYVRENYQKDMEPVIASEIREASGHRQDLSYLLALYSMGPSKEGLLSPLPRNSKLTLTEYTQDKILINLSESIPSISDADFTLASACIALTCTELTGIRQITVACGEKTITIQEDKLLQDSNIASEPQEETN